MERLLVHLVEYAVSVNRVEKRLDRFCTNEEWLSLIREWQVEHIPFICFDHAVIKVHFEGLDDSKLSAKKWGRKFHFEAQWLGYDECRQLIKHSWKGDVLENPKSVRKGYLPGIKMGQQLRTGRKNNLKQNRGFKMRRDGLQH